MLRIWALILLNLQVIGKTTKKTLPFLQSKANTSVQACNEGSSWTVSSAANERNPTKQKQYMSQIWKDGIFQQNLQSMKTEEPLIRERNHGNENDTKFCSRCRGFYAKRKIAYHKCEAVDSAVPRSHCKHAVMKQSIGLPMSPGRRRNTGSWKISPASWCIRPGKHFSKGSRSSNI